MLKFATMVTFWVIMATLLLSSDSVTFLQNQHFSSKMTKVFDREELIEKYALQILDSMDMKTMEQFVMDTLTDNLNSYSDEELITEVEEYYPELIEE